MRSRTLLGLICLPWLLTACTAQRNSVVGPLSPSVAGAEVAVEPGPGLLFSATAPSQLTTDWGGPIQYLANDGSYITTQTGTINSGVSTTANLYYGGVSGHDYYLRWAGGLGAATPIADNTNNLTLFLDTVDGADADVNLSAWHGVSFYARGSGNFAVELTGPGLASGQQGPYTNYNYYTYVFGNPGSATAWRQYRFLFTQMVQEYGTAVPLQLVLQQCWGLCFQQVAPFDMTFTMDIDDVRLY